MVLGAVVAAVMADGEYAPPAYEKKYDGYFQYANVPGDTEYEFGYNRGNPSHYTSRYEQSKDSRFRTKANNLNNFLNLKNVIFKLKCDTGQVGW